MEKFSIFKSDLSEISDLSKYFFYKYWKIYQYLVSIFWLLAVIGIPWYVSKIQVNSDNEKLISEILSFDIQKSLLVVSTIGVLFSLLVIGGNSGTLVDFYYKIKEKDNLPKGIDIIISSAIGTFGILLFIFLHLVNKEGGGIFWDLYILLTFGIIFFALMQSVLIIFNNYSIISTVILFITILLPPYLANQSLTITTSKNLYMSILPLVVLFIAPIIQRIIRNKID